MAKMEKNGSNLKFSPLNCIDLSNPDVHQSVSLLKQACLDTGFFYAVNHGITEEFMDEVFAQSKKLFSLSLSDKMKLLRNEKHRGYTPILDELLDPDNQIRGDYKEGYYIGVEEKTSGADSDGERPFYGPNIWPEEDLLPGWREIMEEYHRKALYVLVMGHAGCLVKIVEVRVSWPEYSRIYKKGQVERHPRYSFGFEVARAIARLIALALGLEIDFFNKSEMLGEPIAVLRLLHYEDQISEPAKGIFGAGAHSDYGLITLLATDENLGLQICKDKDAKPQIWEYVAPLKGAFVVNLGDMLERWSNCIFKSTLHRVLVNGQERYSIAYFVEPSHDCLVECLPTCKSDKNPPKFPPILCGAYLSQRYNETHVDLITYKKDKEQT